MNAPAGAAASAAAGLRGGLVASARRLPRELLGAALLLLATRVLMGLALPLASEDAYITFRYARMLVAGHGLVFNPGEAVMGFTSLPWALWCALALLVHVDPVVWTRVTGVLADLLTLALGWQVLEEAAGLASARTFAFVFAGWPLFAASAVSGLESSAFTSLALVAAWCVARGSPVAGPALGALAVWRPEGLVAAAVVGVGARPRARLVALALVAIVSGGLALMYGSPVPQSVLAKAMLYGTPGPWAGRHWWDWLVPFPLGRYPVASEGIHLLPLATVLAASVARGAVALWERRRSAAALAAGAGVAVWLGYALLGVAYFWWYLVLPLAAFMLLASAGFPRLVRGRAIPLAAALAVLGSWTLALPLYAGRARAEYAAFSPVAELLHARGIPGQSVFLEPIGLIGYRSELRVIDESGLVSPAVAARRSRGPGWYADVVAEARPEWLVVRADVLESGTSFAGAAAPFRSPVERDAMLAHYRLVLAPDTGSGQVLAVFRRELEPGSTGAR